MLVDRTNTTVLPVAVISKNFKITPFFGKVTIRFGKPISADELREGTEGLSGSDKYNRISENIFDHILELL